jgi:hypothetical protein
VEVAQGAAGAQQVDPAILTAVGEIENEIGACFSNPQEQLKTKLKVFLLGNIFELGREMQTKKRGRWNRNWDSAVDAVRENFKKHCLAHFVWPGSLKVVNTPPQGGAMPYGNIDKDSQAISQNTLNKSHFVDVDFSAVVRDFIDNNTFAEIKNIYGEKYIVLFDAAGEAARRMGKWSIKAERWPRDDREQVKKLYKKPVKRDLRPYIPGDFAVTTGLNVPGADWSVGGQDVTIVGRGAGNGKVKDVIFLFNAKQCAASTKFDDDFKGGTFFPLTRTP